LTARVLPLSLRTGMASALSFCFEKRATHCATG
jgi:hypothetical protein